MAQLFAVEFLVAQVSEQIQHHLGTFGQWLFLIFAPVAERVVKELRVTESSLDSLNCRDKLSLVDLQLNVALLEFPLSNFCLRTRVFTTVMKCHPLLEVLVDLEVLDLDLSMLLTEDLLCVCDVAFDHVESFFL